MERNEFRVPVFSDNKLQEFLYLTTSRCVRGLLLSNKRGLDTALSQQITSEINTMVIVMHRTVLGAKAIYVADNPQASQAQVAAFVWSIAHWCYSDMMKKYRDYRDLAEVTAEEVDEILSRIDAASAAERTGLN